MSGMTFNSPAADSRALVGSLVVVQEFLSDILQTITELNSFENIKEFHRNQTLSLLSNDITRFVELTTLMSRALSTPGDTLNAEVRDSHIHLLFIMKALTQASQKQDLLILEDLIKYELKDNLTQWKIDFIPQMRRLLNL